ncbi:MAG: ComF family protein [Micrococcales bacterium]|nr:ComF family protein [Micrococcales bacterium]
MTTWWRVAVRDLLGLVLPVSCAGCGADDLPWCQDCAATLAGQPWRAEGRAGRLDHMDGRPAIPVWAVADFAGPVRRAVSAWKDHGRVDLTPVFGAAVRRASSALVGQLRSGGGVGHGELEHDGLGCEGLRCDEPALRHDELRHDESGRDGLRQGGIGAARAGGGPAGAGSAGDIPVLVIPAPSTPAARRRRGWDPAGALAKAVADELVGRGVPARATAMLRRAPGADQAGLSARARSRNLSGHVRVRRGVPAGPRRAVLVDDVLTTGATFAACVQALAAAGIEVVGGAVVATTPSPDAAAAP